MKVCVETYGCTMNHGEGIDFQRELDSLGHEVISNAEEADLVVLNTCTVIRATQNKMMKRLTWLSQMGKKLVVTGCMAKVQPEEIRKVAPDAEILDFDRYPHFSALISDWCGDGEEGKGLAPEITEIVPIAQGCLGSCTYCITRLARGGLISYPEDGLLERCSSALRSGSRELLLTAQDTSSYGLDLNSNIGTLLERVCELPGDFRIRVGMMNPDTLSQVVGEYLPSWRNPKVYKFLHLPVQSGSDSVLDRMGRRYHPGDFLEMVSRFREECPDMTLSTDVILGFPGETQEDFEATVELVMRVKPNILNITRFSPRPGTPAAQMDGGVPGWKVKEWSRHLTRLRFEIAQRLNRNQLGRIERALVTERGKKEDLICRTDGYWPVVIKEKAALGDFITVELVECAPTHFFGRLR
jgi:threonylcarbamoyladenosine tRNA methylthiotransferase CDKAL1